ncbi:ATP-binding protein [Saccharothrix sp. Mg75]|uniref:ATP-binding protein n=1 Tax=Saccharothrix sp. Mg75 TaxID=3445357 RepID=UPI003EEA94A5
MIRLSNVHNKISGMVAGTVVQAGVIEQVVLPVPDTVPVPRQLPVASGDFTGRAAETAALDALLTASAASPVCVMAGPPGVGKTTLAVWWAHRVRDSFPDGTLFVNLRGHDRDRPVDPSSALVSILHALGLPETRIPVDLADQSAVYRSLLATRRVLVVLDNAGSAEQVRPLLPGTPGSVTLVTSRRALIGLTVTDGARSLPLGLFARAEAETLLRRVLGADRVDREPQAVARLVELCARLPLALRVAAGRVAARPLSRIADLVAEIEHDRLDALSDTDDDRSAVTRVFDWSYHRLPDDLARLFRVLGLHPGPEFGPDAAAALSGTDPRTAARRVEALVDANLVTPVAHRRYHVHDLLHLYASRRAEADDPVERLAEARRDGLAWYARTALAADRLVFPAHPHVVVDLDGPPAAIPADRAQAWAWFTTEHRTLLPALRQALAHDLHDIAVALAASMRYLVFRPVALCPVRLEVESAGLLAARARGDVEAEMAFLRRRADTYQLLGRWEESDADLAANVEYAVAGGDRLQLGKALCGLGHSRTLQRRLVEARDHYLRALPLVRGSGYVEAVVESNLSRISAGLGKHADAVAHAERELVLRRSGDDPVGVGYALHDVAVAHQCAGDHQAAVEFGERAIDVYREAVATDNYLVDALHTVALSHEHRGEVDAARGCLLEAAEILTRLGDPRAEPLRERVRAMSYPRPGRY